MQKKRIRKGSLMDNKRFRRILKTIRSNLRIEDYVAIIYVIVIALIYLYLQFSGRQLGRGLAVTFYYFMFPFILVLFKEAFAYFLSDKPSTRRFVSVLRDWFPFLIILSMYYSLYDALSHLISFPDCDAQLAALDMKLFGFHASIYLERFIHIPWLVDWLSLSYFSFVFLPPVIALYFYMSGRYVAFRIVMLGFVITESLGCVGYVLFPAVGPRFAFREWYSVTLSGGPITYFNDMFINMARLPRDCVPSLHVGLTALFYFAAWRYAKKLFVVITPVVVSLWFACVFLRYHYVIDCVAGFLLAMVVHVGLIRFVEPYFCRKYDQKKEAAL